jgi:hypothetical protein
MPTLQAEPFTSWPRLPFASLGVAEAYDSGARTSVYRHAGRAIAKASAEIRERIMAGDGTPTHRNRGRAFSIASAWQGRASHATRDRASPRPTASGVAPTRADS